MIRFLVIFNTGDHFCREDKIGREMFIVNKGELEVVDKKGNVLAKLLAGRPFGEISILDMNGIGNRRTATVRSVGFSDLFRLSKKDLEEVIEYYPEEKDQLAKIARQTYEKQQKQRQLHQTVTDEDGGKISKGKEYHDLQRSYWMQLWLNRRNYGNGLVRRIRREELN